MSGWAAFGSAMANLTSNVINYKSQLDNRHQQLSLQRDAWEREDTAVQRRKADLLAAGMSPVLAAGQGAQTSSPIQVQAPQLGELDPVAAGINSMLGLTSVEEKRQNIATSKAQEALLNQQAISQDAQRTLWASQVRLNTFKEQKFEAERIKDYAQVDLLNKQIEREQYYINYVQPWNMEVAKASGQPYGVSVGLENLLSGQIMNAARWIEERLNKAWEEFKARRNRPPDTRFDDQTMDFIKQMQERN